MIIKNYKYNQLLILLIKIISYIIISANMKKLKNKESI